MKTADHKSLRNPPDWHLARMNSTSFHIYDTNVQWKETIPPIGMFTRHRCFFVFLTGRFLTYTRFVCDPLLRKSDWNFVVLFWLQLSSSALGRTELGSSGICKKRLYLCFGWQPSASSLPRRLRGGSVIGRPWRPWQQLDAYHFLKPSPAPLPTGFFVFFFRTLSNTKMIKVYNFKSNLKKNSRVSKWTLEFKK